MKHFTSPAFWEQFDNLPAEVQRHGRDNYELLRGITTQCRSGDSRAIQAGAPNSTLHRTRPRWLLLRERYISGRAESGPVSSGPFYDEGPRRSGVRFLVPEISRFFGIVVAMYHREHEPAHFHARYAGKKGTVRIDDGVVEGELPLRVKALLLEWWNLHREELEENWRLAKERKELNPIPPLE